jgi:uncharacterized RDD family membrane protein YckC
MSGALAPPDDETVSVASASAGRSPTPPPGEPADFPREFGGYRLLGRLGTGGMGTVYEAEQLATGRRVALKILEQQLDSPDMRQRFLREGRLAASVNHPNSLYIFGSEEIDGVPVITMEIAGSGTLKDKLDKRGAFPLAEAVDAILDVVSGLEAAFASGVLHRDIKPSNCFVSPDGSVKVGDFGLSVSTLARDDSYATATGVIMGTPAYAPPEQLRGDELNVRADIYSVGATLFTLLTGQAPFKGRNAVQVVTNVVNQKPRPLRELRADVPPGLERVVARCLAKEPDGRFSDYTALRDALLPFSSSEPEPASLTVRAAAGWVDYLIAFLPPYVVFMLFMGNDEFHLRFLTERTLSSAGYYVGFLSLGLLYFTLAEGIWGAGLGKQLRGLRVVRANGRTPGIGRALVRILIPVLSIEGVRIPLLLATFSATRIDDLTAFEIVMYSVATALCPWIPVLLSLTAGRENRFSTIWDLASGTRVVVRQKGTVRLSLERGVRAEMSAGAAESAGPYQITEEIAPGRWSVATDPVLRRQVWLLRREAREPSLARRNLARAGRPRWLQKVETAEATWDAFEATQGVPFSSLVDGGKRVPWGTLRHWLHDLASELWAATGDRTLPTELSLDQVWITAQGQAVLLDEPWPHVKSPAERIPVEDIEGQQRFLSAVAASVERTGLPLHARPVLQNLEAGKFEKLSFLAGTLRGLLDKPAEVSKGIRAGAMFMIPSYTWIMIFVGAFQGAEWLYEMIGNSVAWLAMTITVLVLLGSGVMQALVLPLRTTGSYSIFRLAVVNAEGKPADRPHLLARWAIAWLPLLLPMSFVALLVGRADGLAFLSALVLILLWLGAALYAVAHPNRGLHDRLAGTWVVRR